VDYEGERPEPLPNLDFKIETGDSLLSQVVGVGQQLALRKQQIEEFQRAKAAYMMAHGGDKQRLHEEIEQRKAQLEIWTHGGAKAGKGFDWPVEFAEVFASGGFDIVLANPPYVRQELIKDIK